MNTTNDLALETKAQDSAEGQIISIPKLDIKSVDLLLVGDSPLICHNWNKKAKQQMLDKQTKTPKGPKEAKDPQRDYEESLYYITDSRYGFPCTAFKSAAVDACRFVDGIKMTEARGAFHVNGEYSQAAREPYTGELVEIFGVPSMRGAGLGEPVRVGMGTADLRFRGEFRKWSTKIQIRYNVNVFSLEQITNLFNNAGFGVGVGEWRPEKNGSYGMFHVALEGEV